MSYYPGTWSDYIGQKAAVRQLQIKAKSAKARGVPMGHALIYSPIAGIGKSALAHLAAAELGTQLVIQTEPIKPNRVRFLFADLKDGDVVFLDEFHKQLQGGKASAEWLLQYLAEGVIPGPRGNQDAPAVTVIAATTDVGKLTAPFLSRFEIQLMLAPYTDDEAAQIVAKLGWQILESEGLPIPTPAVCATVARAASNVPRDAGRVLEQIRDLVMAGELDDGISDGSYDVTDAITMAGFTSDGLTPRDQKYLLALYNDFNGEAGERPLKSRLGEVGEGLYLVENKLVDRKLITLTPQGRIMTTAGIRRTRELLAA